MRNLLNGGGQATDLLEKGTELIVGMRHGGQGTPQQLQCPVQLRSSSGHATAHLDGLADTAANLGQGAGQLLAIPRQISDIGLHPLQATQLLTLTHAQRQRAVQHLVLALDQIHLDTLRNILRVDRRHRRSNGSRLRGRRQDRLRCLHLRHQDTHAARQPPVVLNQTLGFHDIARGNGLRQGGHAITIQPTHLSMLPKAWQPPRPHVEKIPACTARNMPENRAPALQQSSAGQT